MSGIAEARPNGSSSFFLTDRAAVDQIAIGRLPDVDVFDRPLSGLVQRRILYNQIVGRGDMGVLEGPVGLLW